jgi:ATP-dependent DNA helicase RecG
LEAIYYDQVNDQANDQVNDQAERKTKYQSLYSHIKAMFYGNELSVKPSPKQIEKVSFFAESLSNEQEKLLQFAYSPKSNIELQEGCLGLKKHSDNFKKHIEPLLVNGSLKRTLPKVPNSPLQKYFTTNNGKIMLLIKAELKKKNTLE